MRWSGGSSKSVISLETAAINPKIKEMEAKPFANGEAALQAIDQELVIPFLSDFSAASAVRIPENDEALEAAARGLEGREDPVGGSEDEGFEDVDVSEIPEAYSLHRGHSGLTHISNKATNAGYACGAAAAVVGTVVAVAAAPAAGLGAAGTATLAAANCVVWGGVGNTAGKVRGTLTRTLSNPNPHPN